MLASGSLALALFLALAPPSGEVRRETWPDGTPRAEYEVELRANGREVRSGSYRSWHANGQSESEGTFADDRETGRWRFTHPSGERAAEGSFARGERTGTWETFHANGARESKGRYEKGRRTGEWNFSSAAGAKDALNSGTYEPILLTLADGRTLSGERLDGSLHGEWKSTWPDGAPQLAGRFARGMREGRWPFHHPDGSLSALLSAQYEHDRRVAGRAPDSVATHPSAPQAPEAGLLGWPAGIAALEAELEAWLAADTKKFAQLRQALATKRAQPSWIVAGPRALPVVLRRLLACDPGTAAGRALIGRLETRILRPLCAGHALVALTENGPATAEEAREFVQAWASLWAATRDDAWFWRVELPLAPVPVEEPDELFLERPFRRSFGALRVAATRPALLARRFETRDKRAEGPLQAALDWLEQSQLPDGHWSASFGTHSSRDLAHHEGGVTALALLALLGAGRTSADSAAVCGALGWLLGQQNAKSGEIPAERTSHDWLYTHAMATLALCEAHALFPSELLRPRIQKAVEVLFAARNPFGAWRYDLPPVGDNDTSVTAWVTTALVLAREAGFSGDFQAAFDGARGWIDEVSDPTTGRVGYSAFGELSSRSQSNERFPREKGEAMTAAGLFVRRLLGVPPQDESVQKQLALLGAKPPLWDPLSLGIDEYYFFYGSQAVALCGALERTPWGAGLREIARAQNGNAAERGSWDPVGVWAEYGGRVYSTALLALTLEAPYRYALPDLEPADKSADKRDKQKK